MNKTGKKILKTEGARWFDNEVWKHASEWERWVAEQIKSLSEGRLKVDYTGFGTGIEGRIEDDRTDEEMAQARFDLSVKKDGIEVAEVEVAADRKYSWILSTKIPTRADKVKRAKTKTLPSFMVYILTKESPPKALWLPFAEIEQHGTIGNFFVEDETGKPIKLEKNYYVPKEKWHIGLESLVQNLKT